MTLLKRKKRLILMSLGVFIIVFGLVAPIVLGRALNIEPAPLFIMILIGFILFPYLGSLVIRSAQIVCKKCGHTLSLLSQSNHIQDFDKNVQQKPEMLLHMRQSASRVTTAANPDAMRSQLEMSVEVLVCENCGHQAYVRTK
ncbi:MAG: hypothetical protein ACNA7K_01640 [Acholeplasmataceae bacterium]